MEHRVPTDERERWAIILVDHGSKRDESNEMLNVVVAMYLKQSHYSIVEPAHMELAEPDIATAFTSCVEQGATTVVVQPFFLFPGRHWYRDIPDLVETAAQRHPQMRYLVTAPLGAHPLMIDIMQSRMEDCVRMAESDASECEFCTESRRCQWRSSDKNASQTQSES